MKKLSVIIVNYNVKHFLEQCLHSVISATTKTDTEIFVVDNNSVDGSIPLIKNKFPQVHLIANTVNRGFSKANNQAIGLATGEYILLLNPDTVLQEDTIVKCIEFMDQHPEAGMTGVKMIDGKGRFLPESKRGMPRPLTAFYRISGLSSLFPRSKTFARYYLGHLDKNQIHEVDVLCGAFMMIRSAALKKTGLLDESFFMYGEDIDLSYRMQQQGYKNFYLPNTTIIHYKGESTKKSTLNYVLLFYKAMIIFANKHFSRANIRLFTILIQGAIYFRAILSILRRLIAGILLPLADSATVYMGYYYLIPLWEKIRIHAPVAYPPEFNFFVVPAYIIIWLTTLYFTGGYDKPVRLSSILKGVIAGTIVILVLYALLPEHLRFSRALILLGSGWCLIALLITRILSTLLFNNRTLLIGRFQKKRIAIVGYPEEADRVTAILHSTTPAADIAGYIYPEKGDYPPQYIGTLFQLQEMISVHRIEEIIFCAREITTRDIISEMLKLAGEKVDFKIAPPESMSVIGSNSVNTSGDLYTVEISSINKPVNRRNKRLLDIGLSLFFLLLSPLLFLFIKKPIHLLLNIFYVLTGKKTWVGYIPVKPPEDHLPPLKTGVLDLADGLKPNTVSAAEPAKINIIYAKEYSITHDIQIILNNINRLDKHIRDSRNK